jgi:hypothetical protein
MLRVWLAALFGAGVLAMPGAALETRHREPGFVASVPYRPDGKLMLVLVRVNNGAPTWFALCSSPVLARHRAARDR